MNNAMSLRESLLFVQALTAHLDRIEPLFEQSWLPIRRKITDIIARIETIVWHEGAEEDKLLKVNAAVDELFDLFSGTPAESLVRDIDRQARKEAQTLAAGARSIPITAAGETRSVSTGLEEGEGQHIALGTLLEAVERLREASSLADKPFSAYPRLDAPAEVEPEATFEVIVGFRAEADPDLAAGELIVIDQPDADEPCLVILRAEGAEVLGEHYGHLPLKQNAALIFTCRARADVAEILLSVDYFYDNQPIGLAQRRVRLSATALPDAEDDPKAEAASVPMRPPDAAQYVDLNLIIHQIGPKLSWTLSSHHLVGAPIVIETELSDPRQFCASMLTNLKTQDFKGPLAYNILTNIGRKIADQMPAEFFETLQTVYQVIKRIPTLLILTNEHHIPWELALLDEPLAPEHLPFLTTQSIIGRWVYHKRVATPPPVTLNIAQTTVAASDYSDSRGLHKLSQALQEQASLCAYFRACRLAVTELEMTSAQFEAFLNQVTSESGHLLHIAAHGLLDPAANEHYLLLAGDPRKKLPPSAMVPARGKDEPPRFSFVFLNACQVGAAGEALGQAAGFPGDLIHNGVQGFVAPLWEIHEGDAYALAEAFYRGAVGQALPLAEFLHHWRRDKYKPAGSTTPMAYIFYGHPRLRLEVAQNLSAHRQRTGECE